MIKKTLIGLTLVALLQACSTPAPSRLEPDYRTPGAKVSPLEVPPDLTPASPGQYYEDPGSVRASEFQKVVPGATGGEVLPEYSDMRILRQGSTRSLLIMNKDPSQIWPLLEDFWQDNGFAIEKSEPQIGHMETKWAENRSKIPQDFIRNVLTNVGLGSMYSSDQRDKFRTRLHRDGANTIVIFSHESMREILSRSGDFSSWQPMEPDPELDEIMLARFMQSIGGREVVQQRKDELNNSGLFEARKDGGSLLVSGDHDRNAYRLGLALERVGLNPVSRDANAGIFVVEPLDATAKKKKNGFFSKITGKRPEPEPFKPKMLVRISRLPDNSGDRIVIMNENGQPARKDIVDKYIDLIWKELR